MVGLAAPQTPRLERPAWKSLLERALKDVLLARDRAVKARYVVDAEAENVLAHIADSQGNMDMEATAARPHTREIVLHVGATCPDMDVERNLIWRDVLPYIRELCRHLGFVVRLVDPRIGLPSEFAVMAQDEQSNAVPGVLGWLAQISDSFANGSISLFIALIGDKYGFCPLPEFLSAANFEAIHEHAVKTHNEVAASALRSWYALDNNIVPNQYRLRRAAEKVSGACQSHLAALRTKEQQNWPKAYKVIGRLMKSSQLAPLSALHQQVEMALGLHNMVLDIPKSMTADNSVGETDISAVVSINPKRGTSDKPTARGDRAPWWLSCFKRSFVLRETGLCMTDKALPKFFDVVQHKDKPHELDASVHHLLSWLVHAFPKQVMFEQSVEWQDGGLQHSSREFESYLEQFTEAVTSHLVGNVRQAAAAMMREERHPAVQHAFSEALQHNAICWRFSSRFVQPNANNTLEQVMEYLHSTDEHILVLYGAKGMGKTSMLSAAAHKIKAEFEIAVKEAGKNKPNREALQKLVQALEGREAMVWEMFQEMDKDGSAALDKEELKEGLDMLGVSMTDAELDSVMIAFDQDGGGDVDYVEFYEVLEKFTAAQAAGALQPLEGYTIVLRYTGSTVASSSSLQMMNSMCEQIAASYGHNAALHVVQPSVYAIPPESASVQHNGASTRFWEHLRMATALKPLLIFIDGLENLRLPDGNIDIDWIPANLPTHVRLVATLGAEGTDRILSALQEALPEKAIVDIGTIDSGDATNMVQKWLKDDRRSLKAEQQRRLQNVATDPSPLYVSMAYNVTKLWRSYMLPSETTIQPTLTSVISQFFDNIDAAHPDGLLAAALQFLVGTRVGISELELDDLLALDDSLLLSAAPWIGTDPDSLAVSRLPTYFVSRLLADLSPMLLKITSGGGEVVYIWAHEQFRTAASYRANYPTRSSQLCEMIAGYFGQHSVSVHTATIADTLRNRHDRCLDPQPLWRGVVPNYRAVSELPVACERASLFPSLFGLLTSLNFIEAKFSAGLGLDLITDYAMLDLADLTVEQTDTLAQFREFVLRNRTLLHHRPAQTLQQAFLEHRDGHIFQAAQQMAMQAASGDPEFIRFAVAPADCAALIHRPGVLELLNPPAMPTNVLTISATPDIEAGWIDGAPFVANEEDAVAGISACCFGPDGNYLLVASYDQIIRLYSIPSGRVLHSLTNFSAPITLMATAVPADSSRCLIAAGHSYTINLWDITSNAQEISDREVQLHHTHPLTAIQICRGAELLAAASVKGMIKIWSTTSGSCLKSVSLPSSEAAVCCLAWTPDSSYLLVGSEAQQLALLHLIWDTSAIEIARIKFTAVPGMEGSVIKHAEFSADSHSAMTCSADGQVTLWSCRSGTTVGGEQRMKMKLTKKLGQQRGGVIGCQYSRSSRELIVAAGDGSVCRWDVSSGNLLLNCTSSVPCPLTVALCRNRPLVASVMRNGRVHVWLLPSSEDTPIQQAAVTPIGRMGAIKCIDFSCDGQQIVIGSDETFDLELRSVEGFRLIRTMSGHLGAINAVAFDSSGDWVYSASEDRSMRVWSQRHHAMVLMGQHADGLVQCRTAKQSSKSISVSRDGVLKLWSIVQNSSLALVKTIHLNGGSPTSANISDDASRISYCSDSNKLNIWHVKGSDSSTVLDSNIDLTCSAFSRDLDYLAGGAVDQSVVVWDLSARSQIAYLEAHEADIFQVQFAALPHIVASLSCDGALFLWDCQQKLRLRSYCFNASLDQPTAFSVDLFNALMAVGDEAGYVFVMRVHSADVHRNQIKAIQSATDVSMVNNWEW